MIFIMPESMFVAYDCLYCKCGMKFLFMIPLYSCCRFDRRPDNMNILCYPTIGLLRKLWQLSSGLEGKIQPGFRLKIFLQLS